jgi:hypothetical protein
VAPLPLPPLQGAQVKLVLLQTGVTPEQETSVTQPTH